jgi:hypothetical protein
MPAKIRKQTFGVSPLRARDAHPRKRALLH